MRRAALSVGWGTLSVCGALSVACGTAKPETKKQTPATPVATATAPAADPGKPSVVAPGTVDLATLDLNAPTFERDVKPLTQQACVTCHLPFGYAQSVTDSKARMIAVLESGRMPPKSSDWKVAEADVEKYRAALVKALKNLK